jgi:autotransporter-associated beta strand protein
MTSSYGRFKRICGPGTALGLLLLAGCGGGGGGSVRTSPPPAAPPPTPPVVEAANPAYSKHLLVTNTAPARAAGLTGAGIKIGVVDSGVNRNHPALSPRVLNNLVYISSSGNNLSVDDVVGHGTAVSQIMAGVPFGAWPGGIAPGAQIISARIISDDPPEDDGSGQGNEVNGALGLKSIHQDLIERGARIMNNSWGGLYWTNLNATAPIADEYRPFIISNDGLVVFAAGNESLPNPSDMASLPSKPGPNNTKPAADLERGWLTVIALETDNPTQIASYSNACGIAMRYCLAAPGDVVVTGTNDSPTKPEYWSWRGTSLAAPQVSGAAALVWQAFPYFNNDLIRQTLLGTARDLGAPGVDPVYGYGSLDVGKAINGPARFDWGNVTATVPSGTSNWNNAISGTGGLTKAGIGTLVLGSAENTYTGPTVVMDGILRVGGTLGGAVQVSAGRLEVPSGKGGLRVDGDVRVMGSMKLAQDSGLSVVNGNYSQAAGSRLELYVGNVVTATTATLQGGDLQVLGVKTGYTAQSRENVIVTSNGLTGTFDTLSSGPGVFLQATLGYDALSAWLNISRLDVTATAQAMSFTPMSVGSAERIENAFRRIDSAGETMDGSRTRIDSEFLAAAGEFQRTPTMLAAERSLSSLSGELHAADTAFAKLAIEGNRRALASHLDALAERPLQGAWATELDEERGLSHFDLQSRGWMIGHDVRVRENLVVGAAMSETDSLVQSGLRNDRERNRQVEGQLYAAWDVGSSYLLGRTAFGRMDRAVQREVFLGSDTFQLGSDYASRYEAVNLEAGHRFDLGNGVLTPYAGIQSMQMDRDGFYEPGAAGFGLSAAGSRWREDQAIYGLRMEHGWNAGAARISLQAHAEWQRVLSQAGSDIDARFSALDVWSPIAGNTFGGDARTYGLGIESRWNSGNLLRLSFDNRHEAGTNYQRAMLRWIRPF